MAEMKVDCRSRTFDAKTGMTTAKFFVRGSGGKNGPKTVEIECTGDLTRGPKGMVRLENAMLAKLSEKKSNNKKK